jgi:hypothetical protein
MLGEDGRVTLHYSTLGNCPQIPCRPHEAGRGFAEACSSPVRRGSTNVGQDRLWVSFDG